MPWETVNMDQRRVELALRAVKGEETMAALCREFGICRATGYKWLQRWRQGPLEAFREQSRRPKTSPKQTPGWKEERVIELRRRCPDWGAAKLAYRLKAETGIELPRITVHRILKRRGLVRRRDSHPAAAKRFQRGAPNQMWQMDFKGMPAPWTNRQLPLSIVDDHSRYLVALRWQQGMTMAVVRETVSEVFEQAGVPQQMLLDHGVPWWNMESGIGLTQFSVGLMKQGIDLIFSGYRHPQTQGKVERFHGSLERAMRLRGMPEPSQWQRWLNEYRREYNEQRPHEALGMQPPARRWRSSPGPTSRNRKSGNTLLGWRCGAWTAKARSNLAADAGWWPARSPGNESDCGTSMRSRWFSTARRWSACSTAIQVRRPWPPYLNASAGTSRLPWHNNLSTMS